MRRRHLAIGAVAALCALAGCGGGDSGGDSSNGYPKTVEDNFIKGCSAQPGATEPKCQCALDKIEAKLSYDEFQKADAAAREGKNADPKAEQALQDAIKACR